MDIQEILQNIQKFKRNINKNLVNLKASRLMTFMSLLTLKIDF